MSLTVIYPVDPRANPNRAGLELGGLRTFMRGDPRRPWPCLVVAKPKGGTARVREWRVR